MTKKKAGAAMCSNEVDPSNKAVRKSTKFA
jgi:hypothetical protein